MSKHQLLFFVFVAFGIGQPKTIMGMIAKHPFKQTVQKLSKNPKDYGETKDLTEKLDKCVKQVRCSKPTNLLQAVINLRNLLSFSWYDPQANNDILTSSSLKYDSVGGCLRFNGRAIADAMSLEILEKKIAQSLSKIILKDKQCLRNINYVKHYLKENILKFNDVNLKKLENALPCCVRNHIIRWFAYRYMLSRQKSCLEGQLAAFADGNDLDDHIITLRDGEKLKIWNLKRNECIAAVPQAHHHPIAQIDDHTFALCTQQFDMKIWDEKKQEFTATLVTFAHSRDYVRQLLKMEDNTLIMLLFDSGKVKIYNLKNNTCVATLDCDFRVTQLKKINDHTFAVRTSEYCKIWDLKQNAWKATLHDRNINELIKLNNHTLIITSDNNNKIWNFEKNTVSPCTSIPGNHSIYISSLLKLDDDTIAVGTSRGAQICDLKKNTCTATIFTGKWITNLVHLDDNLLAVSTRNVGGRKTRLWDLTEGKCIATLPQHKTIFKLLKIDDYVFMIVFEDGTIQTWGIPQLSTLAELLPLLQSKGFVKLAKLSERLNRDCNLTDETFRIHNQIKWYTDRMSIGPNNGNSALNVIQDFLTKQASLLDTMHY